RVILEDYMRKASLKCHGDGKFVALHEKYVNLFKYPISFEDDENEDNVGDDDDENGDDDENRDNDGGNVNNDVNDCDVNRDSEDVNEGDKDPNGSNLSFGFSKISLEDFGNDSGLAKKDKVVEGNTSEQGTVVEGNKAEERGNHEYTREFYTMGDLFGDNSVTFESMNQDITPEKLPTQKGSPSPKKDLFAMQGDKLFSNQVNAQFKGSKDGLALGGINLKKLFVRHLKQYGHSRRTQVAKVKHTILKLKWKTKENFHDCRIITMLHMETFDGGHASNLDCGLPVESQLQRNMLRRLRFKFSTKILLREINVHAGKMLELAKEFDKTDIVEKMAIIVDAFKKREEHECI
nr:hypothetical protein [Tanacetum cinerariifolium]